MERPRLRRLLPLALALAPASTGCGGPLAPEPGGEGARFLDSPLPNTPPRSFEVISVLDHATPDWYERDGAVLAFDGTRGREAFGTGASAPYGYFIDAAHARVRFAEFTYVGSGGDGANADRVLNYEGHPGYDLRASAGTALLAAADGYLEVPASDPINGSPATFNTLRIVHDNGYATWYLHATERSECVRLDCPPGGQPEPGRRVRVRRGQPIAEVGRTGTVAPHLHFEVRDPDGDVVDPFGCRDSVAREDPDACGDVLWRD